MSALFSSQFSKHKYFLCLKMPDVAAARVTPIIMRRSKITMRSAQVWRSAGRARAKYRAQPPPVGWGRGKKRRTQQNVFDDLRLLRATRGQPSVHF